MFLLDSSRINCDSRFKASCACIPLDSYNVVDIFGHFDDDDDDDSMYILSVLEATLVLLTQYETCATHFGTLRGWEFLLDPIDS